jgi:hypothetical protein
MLHLLIINNLKNNNCSALKASGLELLIFRTAMSWKMNIF